MTYTPTFVELVGDEDEFFSTYFNRMPLLRTGALMGDPREVLSIADLDQLLHFEAIRPSHFGVAENGESVIHTAYTSTTHVRGSDITDVVVPERVYELFRTGATITWKAINQFHPGMRALTIIFATRFAVESGVTAFLTPAGRQGLNPHQDPVDVFVLQLEGTKHWKLWRPAAVRGSESRHHKMEDLGDPVIEVTLQPGDVLYLPYDTPHVAAAEDQVSLHVSAIVRPRLWGDLLRETVERLLDNEDFWEFPYLTETTVADESVIFGERAGLLAKRLQEVDLGAELRRLIATGRQSPGSSQGDALQTIATLS
jgi:ribosomal protein L16 Arg81 hydroxylase